MPIYEYQCSACKHYLEILQKISDEPLKLCPKCQENTLEKCVSKSGFRLKGSGWYKTDTNTAKESTTSESAPAA